MPLPLSAYYQIKNGAAPSDYSTKGCLYPHVITVKDSFGVAKNLVSDCGHCESCQNQVREEWVTRMFLHSFDTPSHCSKWRYCYFVTLTYGSYDLNPYIKHPFLSDWLASFPVADRDNSRGRYCFTPSILCVSHMQKYLKRLRALDDSNTLSYVYCGEYGHQYGRPHWHIIVWSYNPIPSDNFKLAWGYVCKRTDNPYYVLSYRSSRPDDASFFFQIGDVQVSDLGANGTFNECVRVHDQDHDARYAFTYVAKYLRKSVDDVPMSALARWSRAFNQLPVDHSLRLVPEDDKPLDDSSLDALNLKLFNFNNRVYHHVNFTKFKKLVRPCFSSSLRYGIGKEYAVANFSRFDRGDFTLPSFRGKSFVFPRYFHHLLSLRRCPIFFEQACLSGFSFVKSDYLTVKRYFQELALNPSLVSRSYLNSDNSFKRENIAFPRGGSYNLDYVVLRDDTGVKRGVLNSEYDRFDFYSYSRSERSYFKICEFSIPDFCDFVCEIIDQEYERVQQLNKNLALQLDLFNAVESDPATVPLRDKFIAVKQRNQAKYNNQHKHI